MPIHCEIVSQDRIVFQGDVDIVVVPGVEGVMGILPNHSPLLSTLQYGIITIRQKNQEEYFTVAGGVVEVTGSQVTILANAAENVDEINIQRAEDARQRAESSLKEAGAAKPEDQAALQLALKRSTLRIAAVQRFRQRRTR
ncbi:MAG TPA: ATP synthase F1 subunit epsilon [Anaerolineaceae bacterium]|nr:MAG: ATP synthase F1 subunit epsilon [Chloroflexi bacterium GWB2_54_36]HAL17604.1 ATP synthase F1 subunit epsilon [Anaerolineaceae bacterium]HBA92374.1 ATP synthase F1 subunit epsilon [Anaerolineaceae bacterium]